jgi:DNA-binding response OmpR family regulator
MVKILIVDDDRNLADTFAELLLHRGYDVRVAYDVDEALTQAALEPPHAVLLDLDLPAIDGIEVARQLRQEYGDRVRIVACTGHSDAASQRRFREAPFDAILIKPVPLDVIVDALRHPIRRREMTKAEEIADQSLR